MAPDYSAIGVRLKELRRQYGFSQQKIADLTGVSVSYVKNTEGGAKPSLKYLFELIDHCPFSFDQIFIGVPLPSQSVCCKKNSSSSPSEEHIELLKLYDQLDDEGKAIIKAACYQERRRAKSGGSP